MSIFFFKPKKYLKALVWEDNILIHGIGITGVIQSIKGSVEKNIKIPVGEDDK